jgi:nucleotide-binding universal stress UspA family protein
MYARILVPVDGSATSKAGLQEAIRLAHGQKTTLCLLCIASDAHIALAQAAYASEQLWIRLREEGAAILKDAERAVQDHGMECERVLLEAASNNVGELIVRQAQDWHAELIVMGTHGRGGVGRMILGSAAEFVLRHAQVPVLMVRAG